MYLDIVLYIYLHNNTYVPINAKTTYNLGLREYTMERVFGVANG
jgi:hypothetical protein